MYLYIFQRTNYFKRNECKFGISNNPKRRLKEVVRDSGLNFKLIYRKYYETEKEARTVEDYFLGKYKSWKHKKFPGYKELRILRPEDIAHVKYYLGDRGQQDEMKRILWAAALICLLIGYFYVKNL